MQTPPLPTVDEMKARALHQANNYDQSRGCRHCYIYEIEGRELLSILWHSEDKYLHGYLPLHAKVLWHGKVQDQDSDKVIIWDERSSNISSGEYNTLLSALGDELAHTIKRIVDDRENSIS